MKSLIMLCASILAVAACSAPENAAGAQEAAASLETEGQKREVAVQRGGYAGSTYDQGLSGHLEEMPLTDGQWFSGNGGAALFGSPQTEPRLSLSCDAGGGEIEFLRAGQLGSHEQLRMGLYTPLGNAPGYLQDAGTVLPQMQVRFPADQPIFEKIAASQRFGFGADGKEPLLMPVTREVKSVLDACGVETRPAPADPE